MKRLTRYTAFLLCFTITTANAGLISHTDYSSGGTITASGQNANENAIVNEINGNIESANIKDATIVTGDISASAGILGSQLSASAAVGLTQMSTTFQSSFTYTFNATTTTATMFTYRRPVLKFISTTAVDVEANTGTLNQTCILFPNEQRCVTEDTASTSVNRRMTISEAASLSGTKNSGLQVGYVLTQNMWYSVYGVKATDTGTDFVIVATTTTPLQANYATLNTDFGTNGWVYLGMISYGNNLTVAGNIIISFIQAGAYTAFSNAITTIPGAAGTGVKLASTAGATTLTWTYAAGFSLAANQVPGNILIGSVCADQGSSTNITISDSGATRKLLDLNLPSGSPTICLPDRGLTNGIKVLNAAASSIAAQITLVGFYDSVLGVGSNPQL